jgi:hypothetical protein
MLLLLRHNSGGFEYLLEEVHKINCRTEDCKIKWKLTFWNISPYNENFPSPFFFIEIAYYQISQILCVLFLLA